MSYLVGDLSDYENFLGVCGAKVKKKITREDLGKVANGDYQVINLTDLTFFDPDVNAWRKLEEEDD